MAAKKKFKSVNRFGARYGIKIKKRLGPLESQQKDTYVCPVCKKKKVKRQSLGIWQCKKCSSKFAGKAYTFDFKAQQKEEEAV